VPFEAPYGAVTLNAYALAAMRHMHEFGTTAEQLAWVKVAASHHAQHNPNAMLREVVTVDDVLASPLVSDPLHKLDCCVVSDGGGALIVVRPEIARSLKRPLVSVLGAGEAVKGQGGGRVDLTYSGAAWSGPKAFEEAGVSPQDIRYASIYDSFTITGADAARGPGLLRQGRGRPLRRRRQPDRRRRAPAGQHRRRRPVQQPPEQPRRHHEGDRSGAPAARRGPSEGAGAGCELALVNGTGGLLGTRHGSATLILGRE
jgi:acetyl-CoA C-acetyltransferase